MLLPMSMLFLFGRMLSEHGKRVHRHRCYYLSQCFHFYSNSYINYVSEYRGNPILANLEFMERIWKVKIYGLEQVCQHFFTVVTTGIHNGFC